MFLARVRNWRRKPSNLKINSSCLAICRMTMIKKGINNRKNKLKYIASKRQLPAARKNGR